MPRIIVDPGPLSDRWMPEILPVRQEMVNEFVDRYLANIESGYPTTLITLIYGWKGHVGIGKTTIAKAAGRQLERIAARHRYNVKYVYVNVYGGATVHSVVNQILRQLGSGVAERGIPLADKVNHLIDILYMQNMRLFVVIDEVQNIFVRGGHKEAENLYMLLRLHEINPSRVTGIVGADYVLIAQDETIFSLLRAMVPQVESQISRAVLMEPYRTGDLEKILVDRAERALAPGSWDESIIAKIACYFGTDCPQAGDPTGSARKAINSLREAAYHAERRGSSVIQDIDVSYGLSMYAKHVISVDMLRGLSKHELLVLLAVAELTLLKGDYSTTGDVRKAYEEIAELHGEKPRGHSQFHEYIKALSRIGLIVAKPSGKGTRGRTTLIRIPQEIPADKLRSIITVLLRGEGVSPH